MALTIEDLLEHEEIKRLKHRYMRALDTHDWELMATLFLPDARCWFGNGKFSAEGREAILSLYRGLLDDGFWSSHIAVHPEIELTGPDSARAIWRMEDTVHFVNENKAAKLDGQRAGDEMQGAGHYFDEYVKVDGGWKIRSTGYIRLYERVEHRAQRDMTLELEPLRGMLD
jgi:uncharacterized protein (TIGR02246 family)